MQDDTDFIKKQNEILLRRKHLIEEIIAKSGLKIGLIASKLGISRTSFYKWLDELTDERFRKIFAVIDGYVNDDEIANSLINKYDNEVFPEIKEIKKSSDSNVLPVQGHFYKVIMSINAGDPAEIYREENYTGEEVFFPYEKSERCFALKVVGDSMVSDNGRSISEGDFVIADMDAEILNGDIVVIHLANGRQMVKQYISGPEDSIVLRSSNTAYPDIVIKESDVQAMMRVVGKALYKRF